MTFTIDGAQVGSNHGVTIRFSFGRSPDPGARWYGVGPTFQAALAVAAANMGNLANWSGSRYRGVGRKPRGYREARKALAILDSLRAGAEVRAVA